MLRALLIVLATLALPLQAGQGFVFDSIDGGTLDMEAWKGRPVLVVNTASRCGFTRQYDGLQALQDRYEDAGLVVLAVPSGDFRQELRTDGAVKSFCEVNFGLTLPMTTITAVTGPEAHPFYRWLATTQGVVPAWNFNKVLIAGDGSFIGHWGSTTRPLSRALVAPIEAELTRLGRK